mgnify:FL=1|tara:strand:+ start:589 stop:1113 length:525 start_codon:yes stop_codon:yes gene_type:complete
MNRIFITLFLLGNSILAQDISLDKKLKRSNPSKASRLSAIIPGLGQVYNKQYWKVPVIYGGFTVIGHYIKFNNDMYKEFNRALIYETDDIESTVNPFPNFNRNSLERNMEFWRRNRDLLIIFTGVYYLLNIADAHIFSHLKDFNTSNDITFKIEPSFKKINHSNVIGLGINIYF